MSAPLAWCARLAAVDDDALGAALRALADAWRPRLPGLVEILHARVSEPGDAGSVWWLHVGMVFEQPPTEAPEDTAIGHAVQLLVERHTHVWGVLHHYQPDAPALARYHRAPEGTPVPVEPPVMTFPWLAAHEKALEAARAESKRGALVKTEKLKAEKAAEGKKKAAAPAQGGLFG